MQRERASELDRQTDRHGRTDGHTHTHTHTCKQQHLSLLIDEVTLIFPVSLYPAFVVDVVDIVAVNINMCQNAED